MKIDLTDPAMYALGQPYDQFRWLQDNDPIHWHELEGDEAGFFALTRYAHVRAVEGDPKTFSNQPNATLSDANNIGDETHWMLLYSDPPRHTAHRKFLSLELSPGYVRSFAGAVDKAVDDIIDESIDKGECDLVADIGGKLASYVTADLMGLPRELLVELYEISEVINNAKSLTEGNGLEAMIAMSEHSNRIFHERRAEPRDDMVSRMVNGEFWSRKVDAMQFAIDFILMVNAGGDTTRNVVGGGMAALFDNPEERDKLIANPALIPSAVEEMLRWVSPIVYQRRTATVDTRIGEREIRKGTKVAGYYGAANRDPRAFREPDRFNVERSPNAHIAFGFGPHFCLGSHLARQELIIMFRRLLERMPDMEPVAAPVTTMPPGLAPTVVGPRSMPVRFSPGPKVAA